MAHLSNEVIAGLLLVGVSVSGCGSSENHGPRPNAAGNGPRETEEPLATTGGESARIVRGRTVQQLPAGRTQEEQLDQIADAIHRACRAQEFLKRAGSPKGERLDPEVMQEINRHRDIGGDVAAGIEQLYRRADDYQEQVMMIEVLKALGTPDAMKAVKNLALNPGNAMSTLSPEVVKAVASLTSDVDELSEMLDSTSEEIRQETMTVLHDRELTEKTVNRLGAALDSDSWGVHNAVTAVFGTDRSPSTAKLKVDLLLKHLPQINNMSTEIVHHDYNLSPRDIAIRQYVFAFQNIFGADELLRQRLSEAAAGSLEFKVLSISQAFRQDKGARKALCEIARTETNATMRLLATAGLEFVGSRDDIAMLQKIAAEDPALGGRYRGTENYPVREKAQHVIKVLGKHGEDGQ